MSDHTITWTHIGDSVHGHVECSAPEGAPCRRETVWVSGGDIAAYVDLNHCVPAVLLNEHDCFEAQQFYAGPIDSHTSLHDGPVDVRWNGHDWEWVYADQPTPSAEPSPEAVEAAARVQWGFAADTAAAVPWEVCPDDVRERVRELAAAVLRAGAAA